MTPSTTTSTTTPSGTPSTPFATTFAAFLEEYLAVHPTAATAIGDHRYDDRWPDTLATGRETRRRFVDDWTAAFGVLDDAMLSADERIDRELILGTLDSLRFELLELQEERWNPLDWVYLLGDGLFNLLSREFAPLAVRLASVAGRVEGLPAVLAGAREALVGTDDGRPVGRFQTEKAIEQLPGIGSLIDEALEMAAADASPETVALRPRLEAAATAAREALAAFEGHLRDVVLPRSAGEGRLGERLFAARMRHTMQSETLTPERILTEAEREYTAVRDEMVRLARDAWASWCPGRPLPLDDGAIVRGVLDAVAVDHPPASELLDFCRAANVGIEDFCREHDLIGLGDEPMEIRWTPEFLRSFAGAMFIAPGVLDRGLTSFFAITPIPDDWPPERAESKLREDNARMLRLLTIHEAVPGHYLQSVYEHRATSLPRAIFASGLFAEGWAVYVTQVMIDVGYGADDAGLLLNHWKFYLRAVTNAIIDARIHTADMSEDEAVTFMVEGGFQEEAEARAKYDRARLSSTQLSTYFAGSMEMWSIELEARRRAAASVGADAAAIVAGGLPGGFGETPGFRYRPHLEAVIAHGAPPTSLLRRLLFD